MSSVLIEMASHLKILLETPDLVAVYKPAGIHSAPLQAKEVGTVYNGVIALFPECAESVGLKEIEGTLLHRLDKGTSGVLLFARSKASYEVLRKLWKDKLLEKDYLAWVSGEFHFSGTLKTPMAHDVKSKKRMVLVAAEPAAAQRHYKKNIESVTSVKPVVVGKSASLVGLRIHTGVMHQIRATVAALGCSVLGDTVYESSKREYKPKLEKNFFGLDKVLVDVEKSLANKSEKASSKNKIKPVTELLPEGGFFLHAYRIALQRKAHKKSEVRELLSALDERTIMALQDGIVSELPIWFGL